VPPHRSETTFDSIHDQPYHPANTSIDALFESDFASSPRICTSLSIAGVVGRQNIGVLGRFVVVVG
jgi:hypothetical protein